MKTLILLFSVLFTTMSFAQVPSYVPANGLVGWWPFNGNANDESGNGNNGTNNGATLTIDRNGVANNAYEFNSSSNNSISIGSVNLLNDFTINAWYKLNSIGGWQNIISKYGANGGYALLFDPNGVLYAHTNQGTASGDACTSNYIENTNIWHMATLRLSQGVLKFFIDGIDQGSCTSMNNSSPNSSITYFGRQSAGSTEDLNGKLDDIGIWNRALTQQEITNLYTSTVPVSCLPAYVPTSGLVGYWPFCGNANDESGNGNNGTVNGATLTSDRNGNINSAYSFNNNTISIPDNSSIGITQSSGQSISVWAYLTGSQTTQHLLGRRGWNCFDYQIAFSYGDSQGLSYWISEGGLTSSYQIPLNQWVFIVGTYNAGIWKLYINQQLLATDNTTYSFITYPSCPLTFGNSGGFQGFIGKLDDIGIWNRALTDCEIQNLYTSTNPTNLTSQTACDTYTWNGTTYTASGVYTDTSNCVTQSLNLTITPSSTNTTTASACGSYTWNGTTYTTSGVYTGTTSNCVTESLNLTITPSSTNTTTASACGSYTWNGTTYTTSGVYTGTTTNCVTESLNLTIIPSSTNTTTITACNSLTWNGTNYSESGVYTGTTANCVTQALNLTINTNTSSSISQTALDSYTWPVNNQTYTTTGAYTAVIPNAAGCDSTITLNLTMSFTGINDKNASKISIYPNPTNGDFTITGLELVGTVSSLSLTDMNGKIVKVLDTKATKFSMASIKPGVYFLNIISGNKQEVLKIVKE
jgi:hypothetical protein